jgi:hypothetical protein
MTISTLTLATVALLSSPALPQDSTELVLTQHSFRVYFRGAGPPARGRFPETSAYGGVERRCEPTKRSPRASTDEDGAASGVAARPGTAIRRQGLEDQG